MKQRANIVTSFWYLSFLTVFVVGVGTGVYAGLTTAHNIRTSLSERTQSMATLMDGATVSKLAGDQTDVALSAYTDIKQKLLRIRQANHDIRFMYLLGQDEQRQVFFFVDSEDPSSEDYSPPGQSYPEATQTLHASFEQGLNIIEGPATDRWGTWISALSPVYHNNKVVAVLGMDVPAAAYYWQIASIASIPFLFSLLILSVLWWAKRRADYQQRYLTQKAYFLSFASHEIRSPLAGVSWALELLATAPSQTPPLDRLNKIGKSVRHILGTIEEVLNLQTTESLTAKKLTKEPTNIHELLIQSIQSLDLVSEERDVSITDQTNEQLWTLTAAVDASLIKRMLVNFLVNAIKYSPEHDTVEVELTQNDLTWSVRVHNNGPGMSPEDQKQILTGYYRTKSAEASKQKGNGLGLLLSQDIINRHGGSLELTSTPTTGVTFMITVPK